MGRQGNDRISEAGTLRLRPCATCGASLGRCDDWAHRRSDDHRSTKIEASLKTGGGNTEPQQRLRVSCNCVVPRGIQSRILEAPIQSWDRICLFLPWAGNYLVRASDQEMMKLIDRAM